MAMTTEPELSPLDTSFLMGNPGKLGETQQRRGFQRFPTQW